MQINGKWQTLTETNGFFTKSLDVMRGKPFKLPTPRILELILIQINFPDLGPKPIDFPDSVLNAIHFADLNVKPIDFETVSIILLHSIYWLIPTAGFTAR